MAFKGDTEEQIQRHVHVMSHYRRGWVWQLVGQRELVLPTGVYGRHRPGGYHGHDQPVPRPHQSYYRAGEMRG